MSGRVGRVSGRWRRLGRPVLAACVAALVTGPASGAPGDLDAGFGGNGHGRVVVASTGELYGVAVQSDGRIIAVGRRDEDSKGVLVRLRPDGTRDTGFGTRTLPVPGGGSGYAYAVAVQGDGRILVAGAADAAGRFDMAVWRLRPSGALDTSFGTDGFASFGDPAFSENAASVAVDAQGRVVVAGYTSNGDDMIVGRFTGAGTPDTSFNNVAGNGVPYFQITSAGLFAHARGVAVQGDGIVVTGQDTGAAGLPVYRVVPGAAGAPAALDPGFGSGGLAVVTGLQNHGFGVSVQPGGAIVAVGATAGSGRLPAVVRLTPAGAVDPSYGSPTGVHIRVPATTSGHLRAVAPQPNGGTAVAGTVQIDGKPHAFVARLNARGALDKGMGPGGARLLSARDLDARAVAVQPDGRIVTAGTTTTSLGRAGVVYRLLGGLDRPSCHGRKATVVGTRHNDRLRGTGRADVIAGLGGNDTVKALGRGDIVCGGAGRDRLHGGSGDDTLIGGPGRDRLEGGTGHDRLRQ